MKLLPVTVAASLVGPGLATNAFFNLALSEFKMLATRAQEYLDAHGMQADPSPDYPYWNFMPQYVTALALDEPSQPWSSPCFGSNVGLVTRSEDGSRLSVRVESSGAAAAGCSDIYMTVTANSMVESGGVVVTSTEEDGVLTSFDMAVPSDSTAAEEWDLSTKGVRVLRYVDLAPGEAMANMIKTFELFLPEFTMGVPQKVAEMNIDFMSKYTHFEITPRDPSLNDPPPAREVHSGDSFYVMRLDGLNPLLGWAMGSTTGHVTTALWIDDELYVCESTIDDSYWPTDHVQKTPYETWLKQARDADFQVVWVPLNDAAKDMYNETAAIQWFNSQEGFDYGFKTLIWGWLDTAKDNFPCLPPNFDVCLQWELLEPLLAIVDRNVPEIGDMIWNPGYNKRLGTEGLRTAEMYQEAARQGMKSVDVISIPEQDTWTYNTTRYDEPAEGRCMVCCVFVCSMWKAAGVFGDLADSINCAEQTNWDDYALTIHADTYRQIVGTYSLELNSFKTKDLYAHMAESCPSLAPEYDKPSDC